MDSPDHPDTAQTVADEPSAEDPVAEEESHEDKPRPATIPPISRDKYGTTWSLAGYIQRYG